MHAVTNTEHTSNLAFVQVVVWCEILNCYMCACVCVFLHVQIGR